MLDSFGYIDNFKNIALKAIEILEGFTGEKFKSTATKSQLFDILGKSEAARLKIKEGFYTLEAEQERNKKQIEAQYNKNKTDILKVYSKKVKDAKLERDIQLHLLSVTHKTNYIYYNHTNTLKFNWKTWEDNNFFTQKEISDILNTLPKNLKNINFEHLDIILKLS